MLQKSAINIFVVAYERHLRHPRRIANKLSGIVICSEHVHTPGNLVSNQLIP